ncbi:CUB and sushi domain-containing protein 2-like [Branchiostoma lanceolatum]|uniref:CUB and sushi domain-containing protein 2-like n=1 Tax=Branchiostoma lanceolatum TaxID=7740 RepID=UPI00345175ED
MTPVSFTLEENYDWLAIYVGELDHNALLGSYTGENIPEELNVTSNMAHLVFFTDESNTDDGFKIHFKAFDLRSITCPDPGVPNNGYRTGDSFALGSVVSFGCNDGYILLGQERLTCMSGNAIDWDFNAPSCEDSAHACVAADGRYLYEEEGEILPPRDGETGRYQTNVDCSWILVADPGKVVVVEFLEFDIEYQSRCLYDYLMIEDIQHLSFFQSFCGSSLPPVYVSMAPVLSIHFQSDADTTGTGFKIHYHQQNKSEDDRQGYQRIHQLSEDTGAFSSMNYPYQPYRNHVYQQWNITVDTQKVVKLTFVDFDVEDYPDCKADYVVIDDPYEQLGYRRRWCGSCVYKPRTSTKHILYVIFVTDFVIRKTGFSARYEAVDIGPGYSNPVWDFKNGWLLVSDRIKQISVSTSNNQVWALDDAGTPLRRTGIAKRSPQGMQMDKN